MIFYKPVTIGGSWQSTIQTISAYVPTGYGMMQAAVYSDFNGTPWNLLEEEGPVYANSTVANWTTITFGVQDLAPGNYWLAVEITNTGVIQYSSRGNDLFGFSPWGTWPNPAVVQTKIGTIDVQGFICGY